MYLACKTLYNAAIDVSTSDAQTLSSIQSQSMCPHRM